MVVPWKAIAASAALITIAVIGTVQSPLGWKTYPLSRNEPHDGLAVVNQPNGYGLHIWIETNTEQAGICKPRWNPDPARLFNGNGSAPFSSGLASRGEFFEAVSHWQVKNQLHRQSKALCKARAPEAKFIWISPPLRAAEVVVEPLPALEEQNLLPDPNLIRQEEQQMLKGIKN
jgi:hypothetical protein